MKDKLLEKLKGAVANPLRLSLKLFGLVWLFLLIHVILKLTFNYWQPYIIPTEQLKAISDFIDKTFIKDILDFILYVINGTLMMLTSIVCWWFKDRKCTVIFFVTCVVLGVANLHPVLCNFTPIISCFVLPLIYDRRKWIWIIATFLLNFVFLKLSFWLEGYMISYERTYIINLFAHTDYYIILVLNYITFNLIRIYLQKKRGNTKWEKIIGFLGLVQEA